MSRNPTLILAASAIGLLLVLSCAIPSSIAPQTAPTFDSNKFSTSVAGTAEASRQQTAQANLARITPTETQFVYSTPTRPAAGSILEEQPDGSTYFVDSVTGLEMVIPSGWMAMRIGEEEYYSAWSSEAAQRLGFTDILTGLSAQNPAKVRLVALDTQDGHLQSQAPGNIMLETSHPYTLAEAVATQLKHHRATFTSVNVISQDSGELSPNVPARWLEIAYNGINLSTGENVRVYEKLIVFETNGQVTSIKFVAPDGIRAVIGPQFEQVMTSMVFFFP